jgi:hypothetical protein
MPIRAQSRVKSLIDVVDRTVEINQMAIGRCIGHRQSLCLRPSDHVVVVGLTRTELLGELLDAQILVKTRTGRVVEFPDQVIQRGLILCRQVDRKLQVLGAIERTYPAGLSVCNRSGYVSHLEHVRAYRRSTCGRRNRRSTAQNNQREGRR